MSRLAGSHAEWAERKFRELLESAPDAMLIVDHDGRIILANAQTMKLFGYSSEEIRGLRVEALIPRRMRGEHVSHREGFFANPRVRSMGAGLELFGLRNDGTEFPVEISLSPVMADDGTTVVSAAIRDITDRMHVQKALHEKNTELERAGRAKDTFLASMSHELRTPLNAIIGFTGTLLMGLPGPLTTEQRDQLHIVQSSARHLLSLINDILDLAKIESGKVDLNFEPVVVADIVEEVATGLRSIALERGLEFGVELPDRAVVLQTDRRAVRQILINLASNAIKYTEKGFVHIDVSESESDSRRWYDLTIVDSGIGIPQDRQAQLFVAFSQIDPSNTRRFEGAGLGLYLSQKLALLLGGRITFASEVGSGSTFTLSLPR